MKKKKIIVIAIIACCFVVGAAILGTTLLSNSVEGKTVLHLKSLNYRVHWFDSCKAYPAYGNSFYTEIYAERSSGSNRGWIYVFFFDNEEDALKFYGESLSNRDDDISIVKEGNIIYVGNDQGISDMNLGGNK